MWAMMEKLRMFFINKLRTKKSGKRLYLQPCAAIRKKRFVGVNAAPWRAL
jgi:hypothetical protein